MKRKNNPFLLVVATVVLALGACQPDEQEQRQTDTKPDAAQARAEVQQVLDEQAACWSKGDLTCYMQGYWKSDSLVFIGKNGLTYGWQPTLDNYTRSYPDAEAMGKLSFDILEMKPLSEETMLVIGKWMLTRDQSDNLDGHFSVIFKRFPEGWRIIADHSS